MAGKKDNLISEALLLELIHATRVACLKPSKQTRKPSAALHEAESLCAGDKDNSNKQLAQRAR